MGFFQGAYDFEVSGGNFYDIRGDQINSAVDSSLRLDGAHNSLNVTPDYSRHDNRSYTAATRYEQQQLAHQGPTQSQTSTYPGYGQIPPGTAPTMPQQVQLPPEQPPMDYQAYIQYCHWQYYLQWQQWQRWQQQQQQPQLAHQTPEPTPPQQAAPQGFQPPHTQHTRRTYTTSSGRTTVSEASDDEDDEVNCIRVQHQHLNNGFPPGAFNPGLQPQHNQYARRTYTTSSGRTSVSEAGDDEDDEVHHIGVRLEHQHLSDASPFGAFNPSH